MSSSSTTSFQQHTSELESLIEELEQDKPASISQIDMISQGVANFEANKLLYMTTNGSEMDISLISKLQRRIATLEMERRSVNSISPASASTSSTSTAMSASGASGGSSAKMSASTQGHDNNNNNPALIVGEDGLNVIERLQQDKDYELIKAQEIELENQKLRDDLNRYKNRFYIF